MARRLGHILLWPLLLVLIAGCTLQSQPTVTGPRPSTPAASTGKAVVSGQVLSNTNRQPIKNTVVYLAQVHHDEASNQAVFALDLAYSPGAKTDDNGFFNFADITPNEYVLVVGDFYGENDIVREENGNARVYKAEGGKTLDIGAVQVKPNVTSGT